MTLDEVIARIRATPFQGRRRVVALAGPPGSGKSTVAGHLAAADPAWTVVPMDGFHLDNRVLDARGLRARKGAPETFDAGGVLALALRLKTDAEVIHPVFDRDRDLSVAGAGVVSAQTETVIFEGNYLLLDRPVWRDLATVWDLSVFLDVPEAVLRRRLLNRWAQHGFSPQAAAAKADGNDMPNARLVLDSGARADVVLPNAG